MTIVATVALAVPEVVGAEATVDVEEVEAEVEVDEADEADEADEVDEMDEVDETDEVDEVAVEAAEDAEDAEDAENIEELTVSPKEYRVCRQQQLLLINNDHIIYAWRQ